jgi:hypothetical protein
MSHFREPAGSRSQDRVVIDIIEGKSWKARHLRNNCLRQQCRIISKSFRGPCPPHPSLSRLIGHVYRNCSLLTSVHPKQLRVMSALLSMAAYSRSWIRDPSDWKPDPSHAPRRRLCHLASHLFARWPVPEWFGSAWLLDGLAFYQEKDWYCAVAAGTGLRKLEDMPPSITRRALHLSLSAPGDLTVREALRWGQVKALGGTDELLQVVLKSRMCSDLKNDPVWSRLLEKAVAAKGSGIRNFGIIADMLKEVIRTEGRQRAGDLVGLPFRELHHRARRFWTDVFTAGAEVLAELKGRDIHCPHARAQLAALVSTRWARLPYVRNFRYTRENKHGACSWIIRELTCSAHLIAESREMQHCVSTYGKSCLLGGSSIFSMRRHAGEVCDSPGDGNLTVQVLRDSRRIVQIRGKYNRRANSEELRVLHRWAVRAGLSW